MDPTTNRSWMSKSLDGEKFIAIDMQKEQVMNGFTYDPPNPGRKPMGMIEKYRFESSNDGKNWNTIKEGVFGNIVNDPSKRTVRFDKPATARYFKLVCVSAAGGSKEMGAKEIEILGK